MVTRKIKGFMFLAGIVILSSCATQFDHFRGKVAVGMNAIELEKALNQKGILYSRRSCSDWSQMISQPKISCRNAESETMYIALVNNGGYFLGMGSSDVQYQIEINENDQVVEVRTEDVYTFL